jgi:hypothetical protein
MEDFEEEKEGKTGKVRGWRRGRKEKGRERKGGDE